MRAICLLLWLSMSISAGELTGYISDEPCGWNNARPGKEAKECAVKCVKAGWQPVFVPDGKMNTYKVSDKKLVMPFVGDHVAVEGEIKNDVLVVKKVRLTPAPNPPKKSR